MQFLDDLKGQISRYWMMKEKAKGRASWRGKFTGQESASRQNT